MGICSSQKPQQSQSKTEVKAQNKELQIQEIDKDKKGNNSQKSPSQNSVHSLRSLHEQPDKVQQCSSPKSFGRSPVNQSSRNLRQGSMRSLKCSNSPVRGSVQLGVQFYSTNASKKYSLLHNTEQQKNPSTSFLQHNLTGVKVRLELLSKKDEESIKYIYWLKTYQLDHVNILKNLEVHQDNEWYQVVYDYFDGFKLSKLLGSEDLTENLLANIADQMFQTLMYLKEQKLTHGNININSWEYVLKGGNIIIKLIDIKSISIRSTNELETCIYTPPDLVYNSDFTHDRDLWAVMICLFMLGKGGNPYTIPDRFKNDATAVKQIVLTSMINVQKEVTKFSTDFVWFLDSIIGKKHKKHRLNLQQITQNKWLNEQKYKEQPIQTRLLLNMLNYKETIVFHQVILEIMIQEFEQETALQLQKMFIEFDKDYDTILQQGDLVKMFEQYTSEPNLDDQIQNLFQKHQIKQPEMKQYTFLSLAAPRQKLLTTTKLETIFDILSSSKPEITAKNITKYLDTENAVFVKQFEEFTPEKKVNIIAIQLTKEQFIKIMQLIL